MRCLESENQTASLLCQRHIHVHISEGGWVQGIQSKTRIFVHLCRTVVLEVAQSLCLTERTWFPQRTEPKAEWSDMSPTQPSNNRTCPKQTQTRFQITNARCFHGLVIQPIGLKFTPPPTTQATSAFAPHQTNWAGLWCTCTDP